MLIPQYSTPLIQQHFQSFPKAIIMRTVISRSVYSLSSRHLQVFVVLRGFNGSQMVCKMIPSNSHVLRLVPGLLCYSGL